MTTNLSATKTPETGRSFMTSRLCRVIPHMIEASEFSPKLRLHRVAAP